MGKTYYDSTLTDAQIQQVLDAINNILTPSNNGKVLAISGGTLEARSVQWGGGGGYPEPTGTILLSENGLHNVKDYAEANVQVQGGGSDIEVIPLSVTANDTYTAPAGKAYSPVTVNVSGGPSLPSEYKQVEYLTTDASTYTYAYIPFRQLVGDRLKFKAKADWTMQAAMCTGGLKSSYSQGSGYRANWHVRSSYRSLWADGGAVEVLTSDPTVRASGGTTVTYGEMLSPNDFAEIDITFDSTTTSVMSIFYGSYASGQWAPSTDLYELFVFRADGNTAIHLVPCVRVADSVCGFYDLQTSTFLTAVHGSFTAGPDAN